MLAYPAIQETTIAPIGLLAHPTAVDRNPAPADGPPKIAISPLRTAAPGHAPCEYAFALRQALADAIAATPDLDAIAVDTPTEHRPPACDPSLLYALSGAVRHAPSGVRVYLELAGLESAGAGILVWTHASETGGLTPERFAARIVALLAPRVHAAELRRIRGKHVAHLTAYDLVLQARALMFRFRRTSFEEAGTLLRQAIALDPNHPTARRLFTDWARLWGGQGWSDEPVRHPVAPQPEYASIEMV